MNPDQRILKLIEILKDEEVIRFKTDFCREIGLLKQNLRNIEERKNHFTPDHIEQIVKKFKVNANWIFGASDKVFNKTNTRAYTKNSIFD